MKAQFGRLGRSRGVVLREKLLIVGAGGLVCALIFSILLLSMSRTSEARQEQPIKTENKVDDAITLGNVVLVAPAVNVEAGTKLSRVQLRETFWPRDKVPEGAVRNSDEIKDMFAKVNLVANQPILRESLTVNAPTGTIDNLLPEGHRAITIEVDATGGVEGWASPGAHVDLLLTYLSSEDGQTKTKVAVEDAVVLSYNRSMERRENADNSRAIAHSASETATVTLAVPFEDALKIQTARKMGTLAMILRSQTEVRSRGDAEWTSTDFDQNHRRDKNAKAAKTAALPKGFASFVDSAGKRNDVVLTDSNQWYRQGNGN